MDHLLPSQFPKGGTSFGGGIFKYNQVYRNGFYGMRNLGFVIAGRRNVVKRVSSFRG